MRCVVQRVLEARVDVEGKSIAEIGAGLLIFVCAMRGDDERVARHAAARIAKLRVFSDKCGKMNLSLLDVGGSALVVSQFTLAADCDRGNRPGFSAAADMETASRLCQCFAETLNEAAIPTAVGRFGAHMSVILTNDGPATFSLDIQP